MERMLKPMTHEIRNKIKLFKKKKQDIAPLICDVDISNENLSYSFISNLNLSGCSISNVDFSGSELQFYFQKGTARNCSFIRCHFLPGTSLRAADMRTCNLHGVFAPNVDFCFCDLRQCDVCDITFTMFSKKCYKAKFDKKFLQMMKEALDIEGMI